MLKLLLLLIHTEQFVFPFLNYNENYSRCIQKYYVHTYILTKWGQLSFLKIIINITDGFSFVQSFSFADLLRAFDLESSSNLSFFFSFKSYWSLPFIISVIVFCNNIFLWFKVIIFSLIDFFFLTFSWSNSFFFLFRRSSVYLQWASLTLLISSFANGILNGL